MNIKIIQEAIEQFKTSKEFAFVDENIRMEQFYELAIKVLEEKLKLLNNCSSKNNINVTDEEIEFNQETEEQIEIYTCSDCGKQFPSICNSAPYKNFDLCINCLTNNEKKKLLYNRVDI